MHAPAHISTPPARCAPTCLVALQFGQPVPFRDRRPLPPGAFPDVAATYREEGATHYW